MKVLAMFLILITVSFGAVANEIIPPTPERVREMWETNEDAMIGMIQKCYILEKSLPILTFPALSIAETVNNEMIVSYDGPMIIEIGTLPNFLLYEVTMEVSEVTVARLPAKEGFPWWGYALIGGTLFAGGVVTGVLSTR